MFQKKGINTIFFSMRASLEATKPKDKVENFIFIKIK